MGPAKLERELGAIQEKLDDLRSDMEDVKNLYTRVSALERAMAYWKGIAALGTGVAASALTVALKFWS